MFHLHYPQYKIGRASVYKVSCFQPRSYQPFNKGFKVASIKPFDTDTSKVTGLMAFASQNSSDFGV